MSISTTRKVLIHRYIFAFAGAFIMLSIGLSFWQDPNWIYFTLFVGANMFQSAFTQFCLLAKILEKAGVGKEL